MLTASTHTELWTEVLPQTNQSQGMTYQLLLSYRLFVCFCSFNLLKVNILPNWAKGATRHSFDVAHNNNNIQS